MVLGIGYPSPRKRHDHPEIACKGFGGYMEQRTGRGLKRVAGSTPACSTTLRRHSGVAVFLSKPRRKQRLANPGFQTFRPEGLPGENPAGKEASGRIVAAEERTANAVPHTHLAGDAGKKYAATVTPEIATPVCALVRNDILVVRRLVKTRR